jgi:hypothetical protein
MKLTKAELQDIFNEYNKLADDLGRGELDHYSGTTDIICEHFAYHHKGGCKKCPLRKECIYQALDTVITRLEKRIKRMKGD